MNLERNPQTSSSRNPLRLLFVVALILSAILLFWIRHVSPGEISWNVATYVYMGKTILEGGIPYRDAFDVKGPGIYYIFAFSMLLFGKTALGIEILEGIWQALTALILFRIGKRIYEREATGYLAASTYLVYLLFFATRGGTAEPDRLVPLPMSLGILFLLDAGKEDKLWSWILAGLTMAVAALLKLPAALLGAVMIFAALRRDPVRAGRITARLAALAAGFLTPLLGCAIYFYFHGALRDLWTAQFEFAPLYVRIFNAWGSPACLRESFARSIHIPLYAMAGLALVGLVTAGRKVWRWPERILFAWILVSALSLLLHGLFFPYHFVPLAPPLALLCSRAIAGWKEESQASRLAAAAFLAVFLVMSVSRVAGTLLTARHARSEEAAAGDVWNILGSSLNPRTTVGDTVFLWANAPRFYLAADRRSSSRYFHSVYLSIEQPGLSARRQFLNEVMAHKPKFFAVSKAGAMGAPCPFSQVDYYGTFRRFTELQQFLESGYVMEQDTPRYTLYRRKDVAAPAALRGPLGLEDNRLAVGGTPVNGVRDLHGPQAILTGCGGCVLAGGGADE